MIRICTSLSDDYEVTLIGRMLKNSVSLETMPFIQKRLRCFFNKGVLFYAEYNLRLFFFLLFRKTDLVCAIDLDTILPCYFISAIRKIRRVYDAHELFCEMKEVVTRPRVHRIWKSIEKYCVPRFRSGYTVNDLIAGEFQKMYAVNYEVIRNLPVLRTPSFPDRKMKYILYQGSVNEGRCFEMLIPAMKNVNAPLIVCGDGNFMRQAQALVKENDLDEKVLFKGKLLPAELRKYTTDAWIGITLFENNGLSNYLSLGNRFFDYMHAAVPQLCMNYPAYKKINDEFEIALLIDGCHEAEIADALNILLNDELLHKRLCEELPARENLTGKMKKKTGAFLCWLLQRGARCRLSDRKKFIR